MPNSLLKKLKEKKLDKLADNLGDPFSQGTTQLPPEPGYNWGPDRPKPERTMEEQTAQLQGVINNIQQESMQKRAQEEAMRNAPPEVYDEQGNLVSPKPSRFSKIKSRF